jgi:excisionase family DNA binding protein
MEHALLTPDEAAAYLRLAPSTLKAWRARDFGPAWTPVGSLVRYQRRELDRWLAENTKHASTKTKRNVALPLLGERPRVQRLNGPTDMVSGGVA